MRRRMRMHSLLSISRKNLFLISSMLFSSVSCAFQVTLQFENTTPQHGRIKVTHIEGEELLELSTPWKVLVIGTKEKAVCFQVPKYLLRDHSFLCDLDFPNVEIQPSEEEFGISTSFEEAYQILAAIKILLGEGHEITYAEGFCDKFYKIWPHGGIGHLGCCLAKAAQKGGTCGGAGEN